jgi:ribonuclease Z
MAPSQGKLVNTTTGLNVSLSNTANNNCTYTTFGTMNYIHKTKCHHYHNFFRICNYQVNKFSATTYLGDLLEQVRPSLDQSIQLQFIGTSAMVPTSTRNTSSLVLRLPGRSWIFDAGENAQVGLQKLNISPRKIDKIFVTHNHGDHILGLPGVLLHMKISREFTKGPVLPVEIYGPRGLRSYLNAIEAYTPNSFTKYVVHELHDDERDYDLFPIHVPEFDKEPNKSFSNMMKGGRDIKPNIKTGLFELCEDKGCTVIAGRVNHSVPTYGFVIQEQLPPRKINGKLSEKIIKLHGDEMESAGLSGKIRREFYKVVAALKEDEYLEFENGKYTYKATDLVGPQLQGRKITILGDCSDLDDNFKDIVYNSDVLVHELTNPGLPEFDKGWEKHSVARMTLRGHSNAFMVAKRIEELRPKKICINHLGLQYSKYFPKNEETGKSYVDLKFQDAIRDYLLAEISDNVKEEEIISHKNILLAYDEFSMYVGKPNTSAKKRKSKINEEDVGESKDKKASEFTIFGFKLFG